MFLTDVPPPQAIASGAYAANITPPQLPVLPILSSCLHVKPDCLMSASIKSLRQVFFGLLLFLLPFGFHCSVGFVMPVSYWFL